MRTRGGFTLIIASFFTAIVVTAVAAMLTMGTSEIRQSKADNDRTIAYYAAASGAERMYAHLKSQINGVVDLNSQAVTGDVTMGSTKVASYSATASSISSALGINNGVLGISSIATVNGYKSRVTVKYGYSASSFGPAPLASIGNVTLTGHIEYDRRGKAKSSSSIYLEGLLQTGPLASVTIAEPADLVTVNGGIENNVSDIKPLTFWLDEADRTGGVKTASTETPNYDITGVQASGSMAPFLDPDGTGSITEDMAKAQTLNGDGSTDAARLATFYTNDINGDNVIDQKDAFIYYYTQFLDAAQHNTTGQDLNIGPGEIFYFSPTTDPGDFKDHLNTRGVTAKLLEVDDFVQLKRSEVPSGTAIIFVDGDLYIDKTDTRWKNGDFQHTIVCTGEVAINQPKNDSGDSLTIVSLGDVTTSGRDTGKAQLNGNFIVYTKGGFTALKGGISHSAIFAEGGINIDTYDANKKSDRTMYNLLGTWSSPLGLPPGYRTAIAYKFQLIEEGARWELASN